MPACSSVYLHVCVLQLLTCTRDYEILAPHACVRVYTCVCTAVIDVYTWECAPVCVLCPLMCLRLYACLCHAVIDVYTWECELVTALGEAPLARFGCSLAEYKGGLWVIGGGHGHDLARNGYDLEVCVVCVRAKHTSHTHIHAKTCTHARTHVCVGVGVCCHMQSESVLMLLCACAGCSPS